MNDVIRDFLEETRENLDRLEKDLVTLEKNPTERETLARIFRTLHTVKGTAGFLGLMNLQNVAHAAENLLSRLSAGDLMFNAAIASALLMTVDTIRNILVQVERTEQEGDGDYSELIDTLEQLKTSGVSRTADTPPLPMDSPMNDAPPPPSNNGDSDVMDDVFASLASRPLQPPPKPFKPEPPKAQPAKPEPPPPVRQQTKIPRPTLPTAAPKSPAPPPPAPTLQATPQRLEKIEPDAPKPIPPRDPAKPAFQPRNGVEHTRIWSNSQGLFPPEPEPDSLLVEAPKPRAVSAAVGESSLRVDVTLLDKLMNLVGELVLARNQIMQFSTTQTDPALLGMVQRLNGLTSELQANVMKTRMQPINNVWAKFPRLVRDLALALNKDIAFEMEGRETELDKTIIEAIRDPLTHMVRNAVDHGIEAPEIRKQRGKLLKGRLALHALHEGGKVIIEVADDGGGVDPLRVKAKALQAKLITPEQAEHMTDQELINLIFEPNFSTADKVSQFSGRGVGMDVVRTNIEEIGGTVDIDSRLGYGTTIKIKIPLTLAIIPALTVRCAGDCYAIPQISLLELVRLEGEQLQKGIEHVHGAPVYRLRGELLPLVFLSEQLQAEFATGSTVRAGVLNIVVLHADDRQFGLIVDEIHDTEEIVVKPLQKQLKNIDVFAGVTIMGDGKVALILDVLGLAHRAGVVTGMRERGTHEKPGLPAVSAGEKQTLVLFATDDDRRLAIPLTQVARLEEFPRSALERIGHKRVMQYRGEILPLVDVCEVMLGSHEHRNGELHKNGMLRETNGKDTVAVVVHSYEGRHLGLMLGRIVDIVEETITTRARTNQPCVLVTTVLQGRVTEVLDLELIIRLADPEFYRPASREEED